MADLKQKLVKVDDSIIAFPDAMEDSHVSNAIKLFRAKKKMQPLANEQSEHERQLKPAQPLDSAIPKLPDWASKPLLSEQEMGETPEAAKKTAESQAAFTAAHPKIAKVIEKGDNPAVLGVLGGAKEFAAGMTSPENLALMGGAPESKLLSAFFSVQALKGSYRNAQEAQEQYLKGNNKDAIKYATEALLGAGVGTLAGAHAVKDIPVPEPVKQFTKNEEGSVGSQTAQLKPTTAYKSADQSQPFYLKSENLVSEKMKGPMPAEDVHKMLLSNGVKPEEMKWTGLDEFLTSKGKGKVTPQDIQEHLAGNNLQVQEVQLGGPKPMYKKEELSLNQKESSNNAVWVIDAPEQVFQISKTRYPNPQDAIDYIVANKTRSDATFGSEPKFGTYTLPGAEPGSYRELLVTMPEKAAKVDLKKAADKAYKAYENKEWFQADIRRRTGIFLWETLTPEQQAEYRRLSDAYQQARDAYTSGGNENFRSSHWDEPNVLGHVRFNDRTGPNGERILHLEELQSDWAQKSRKEGFKQDPNELAKQPMKATRHDGFWEVHLNDGQFVTNIQDWQHPDIKTPEQAEGEARRRIVENPERTQIANKGVPPMPFSKTWPELLLKRMMKYASDNNYSGISWTPGEEQASRYDLSKQISRVKLHERPDLSDEPKNTNKYRLTAYDLDKNMVLDDSYDSEDQLAGVIGKEAARKLIEAKSDRFGIKELSGLDLKVGGEGMKGFYDKIIPDAANKLGKQWGAKVGETEINPAMNLTPQEESIVKEYQRLDNEQGAAHSAWLRAKDETLYGEHADRRAALEQEVKAHDHWLTVRQQRNAFMDKNMEVFKKNDAVRDSKDIEKKVPYLPINPQMRAGVKSIPYSLFTIPLAAGALTLQQIKAQAQKLNPNAGKGLPPQPKEALNQYPNPEDRPAKESFAFNKSWSKPGPYLTTLSPDMETKFQKWMKDNPGVVNLKSLNDPQSDYDTRGWWLAGEKGEPEGARVRNKWDGKMHGNDKFKTPYDGGFSRESMYALPNAPKWVGNKLMTEDGRLVTDETPRKPGGQK